MFELFFLHHLKLQPFICLWWLPVIDPAVGNKLRIREEAFLGTSMNDNQPALPPAKTPIASSVYSCPI
jgi:hypothetical protein